MSPNICYLCLRSVHASGRGELRAGVGRQCVTDRFLTAEGLALRSSTGFGWLMVGASHSTVEDRAEALSLLFATLWSGCWTLGGSLRWAHACSMADGRAFVCSLL